MSGYASVSGKVRQTKEWSVISCILETGSFLTSQYKKKKIFLREYHLSYLFQEEREGCREHFECDSKIVQHRCMSFYQNEKDVKEEVQTV